LRPSWAPGVEAQPEMIRSEARSHKAEQNWREHVGKKRTKSFANKGMGRQVIPAETGLRADWRSERLLFCGVMLSIFKIDPGRERG
jgi:hypothetical protein